MPWGVAPIPSIPAFPSDSALGDVLDRLDRWHGELAHWLHIWRRRNPAFFRRLPAIIEQIRLLLRHAGDRLPEGIHAGHGFEKRALLAEYHALLARALGETRGWEEVGEADREFKRAMSLAPEVADYWYEYVRHLILGGRIGEALDEINAVEPRLIQTERESIAQHIINWALTYPELGFGIRADIIKHCISLISREGTGLLVRGCPLPRPPGMKWQRSEILRVLWAGMQCGMPVDELCKREGIDEATYYRWRKRYLPPEWGGEPALV